MKVAIFGLFSALHLGALTCGAAIFGNTVDNYADTSESGYAYAAPSVALLYPKNTPIAPNRAGFDVPILVNEEAESRPQKQPAQKQQPQYAQNQKAPQQQLSQEQKRQDEKPQQQPQQRMKQQQHELLSQQELDLQQEVLTAKQVSALQMVAFSGRTAAREESVTFSGRTAAREETGAVKAASLHGYSYNRPETAFEHPREVYELDAHKELEQNFQHQEVASKHKSHRRGPVKRVRLNQPTLCSALLVNAVRACDNHTKDLQIVVAERSRKRSPSRRLIPHTESLANESYFVQ